MSYTFAQGPYVVPRPHRSSTAHVVTAWIVALVTAGYMLPWAIAATRNKENAAAIALVDLLLGWSLIGWVVSLVMACSANPAAPAVVVADPVPERSPAAPYPVYGPVERTEILPDQTWSADQTRRTGRY